MYEEVFGKLGFVAKRKRQEFEAEEQSAFSAPVKIIVESRLEDQAILKRDCSTYEKDLNSSPSTYTFGPPKENLANLSRIPSLLKTDKPFVKLKPYPEKGQMSVSADLYETSDPADLICHAFLDIADKELERIQDHYADAPDFLDIISCFIELLSEELSRTKSTIKEKKKEVKTKVIHRENLSNLFQRERRRVLRFLNAKFMDELAELEKFEAFHLSKENIGRNLDTLLDLSDANYTLRLDHEKTEEAQLKLSQIIAVNELLPRTVNGELYRGDEDLRLVLRQTERLKEGLNELRRRAFTRMDKSFERVMNEDSLKLMLEYVSITN